MPCTLSFNVSTLTGTAYLAFVGEELHGPLCGHVVLSVFAQSAGQPSESEGFARHGYAHVNSCGGTVCIRTEHQRHPD